MTAISLDLSKKTELRWLSGLVQRVAAAAGDVPFFITGATARDLILQYGYKIDAARKTQDVDFAFMVDTWPIFEALRSRLLATGECAATPGNAHRLVSNMGMLVDLVPFGDIERPDRTIAWPPSGSVVMNVFGFKEALATTISVLLPERITTQVVSLPALALLKMAAWMERRQSQPGKDAYDLRLLLRHYLDAGHRDRLYTEAGRLLEQDNFDYEMAGAWLLGLDMARLLAAEGKAMIAALLERESNPNGLLTLVGDMRTDPQTNLNLLSAMRRGFLEG